MTITPRGGGPLVVATTANPVSGTLTGAQQPQSGDLLVIIHGNDYYAITDMPTPTVGGSTSGVGAISNGTADAGSLFAHIKSYTYVVGSTGDLTVSVTESGLGDEEKVLTVYVLSGADTATPVDIAGNNATTTPGTSHVCPSVNATTSDGFMILHTNDGNGSNGGPYSWPGGTTEQYDGNVASSMSYTGATEQLASSGATGTRTATGTGGSSYAAVTIVIRTAAAGGTPVDAPPANFNGPAPGLGLPNGFPVPWAGTSTTTAQVDAQSGVAASATALTGTAAKVAAVSGRCAAAAFSRGAAAKTTAQTTTSAGAGTVTAAAKKVAPQAGSDAAAARASGAAVKNAPAVGTVAAAAALTGAVGSRPESGTATAAAIARGTAVKVVALTGRTAASAAPRATATKIAAPQSAIVAASMSRAAVVKRATPSSAALAGLSCGATAVKRARPTGPSYAAAWAAKIDLTRSLTGHMYAAAASFPRPNPSDRPGSGTTGRPDSGDILRPYSGVIHRP